MPERHNGVTPFDFTLEFSAAVDFTNAEMAAALQMETRNATVSAKAGDSRRMWTITATPNITDYSQQIAITIRSPERCNDAGAICTADGRKLKYSRVVGVGAGGLKPRPPKPLTVGFILDDDGTHPELDYEHNNVAFDFQLVFSEPLANAPRTGDAAARLAWWQNKLTVHHGGTLRAVSYIGDDGLDVGREVWQMRVRPGIKAQTGVRVPKFTGGCTASNALCTAAETDPNDRRKLNESLHVPMRCYRNCDGSPISQPQVAADPLTAAFSNMPDSHDGSTAFTFRLTFSEDVDISAADLKDQALTVLNGTVTTARALNSGTAEWDITLQPTGAGSLNILVSPTSDCAATGALCTAAGTMLSTGLGQSIPYAAPAAQAQQALAPLTAGFTSVPAEHDGQTAFWLELTFDAAVAQGSKPHIRALLGVTGGSETRIRQKDNRLDHWRIKIQPSSHEAVTVTLSPSPLCGAAGAVCTEDGRTYTTALATRINGPVGISVADATVQEGADAQLDFVVSLSRAATGTVTVDYLTRDGTAIAGQDYTATSGTLTFAAGETTGTVAVPVLDDAHDEGSETMKLKLSNASGAQLTDRKAIGTINNSDPMPGAWMVRFGRTVGSQVVGALGQRLEGASGSHVTVGGINLTGESAVVPETDADDPFGLPEWAKRAQREESAQSLTANELLLGSAFHLSSGGGQGAGAAYTAWGRVARSGFEAEDDDVTMDGDVTSGLVGFDAEWERVLAGVMLSHSTGEGDYRLNAESGGESGSVESGGKSGSVESSLTGVYPYARVALNARVSAWALAGAASGGLTLKPRGGKPMPTDITMRMGAVGFKGRVLGEPGEDALALNVKSDAMWVGTKSERMGEMVATQDDVTRLRVTLEGERPFAAGEGATFTPSAEVGLRHDGGDAETGAGLEVGTGLSYVAGALTVEGKVRTLVAHEDSGYEEWGASGAVRITPSASGRGLMLRFAPQWGRTASAAERLWSAPDATALGAGGAFEGEARLALDAGYGVGLGHGRGVLTPYAGLVLGDAGSRTVRTGARWQVGADAVLGLEGTRQTSDAGEAGNELMLRVALRF